MIKTGIKYSCNLNIDTSVQCGFYDFEVDYSDIDKFLTNKNNQCTGTQEVNIAGISISLKDISEQSFIDVLETAEKFKCRYIHINTVGCEDETAKLFLNIADICKDIITAKNINICIENNYKIKNGRYLYANFSDAVQIKEYVNKLNKITGSELFGACIDIGYANILNMNLRCFIENVGEVIKLMHMNDNNGITLQNQMPYTFTTGRGILSTDWFRVIGALVRKKYHGRIIFNTTGLIDRTPLELQYTMLTLLKAIEKEWSGQFEFEDKLRKTKYIVLFGAGKMAQNYMEEWGNRYKPAFFADNNSSAWGEMRMGVEMKTPDEILKLPEQERLVLICNLFYDEVGEQLDSMGIQYECYWDRYYL